MPDPKNIPINPGRLIAPRKRSTSPPLPHGGGQEPAPSAAATPDDSAAGGVAPKDIGLDDVLDDLSITRGEARGKPCIRMWPGETYLAVAVARGEPRETSSVTNDTGTAPPIIRIWTDGACIRNPGPGGWAFLMTLGDKSHSRFGHVCAQTTNIEMEMIAVIQALRSVKRLDLPVIVFSDLVNIPKGMNEWLAAWEKNGWRNSQRRPVAHRRLWEELKALRDARGPGAEITFAWIKGHAGHAENEEADRLAQAAAAVASRSPRSCRTQYDSEAGLMVPE